MQEIFTIGKYDEKIKFDKIWGYQNEGIPLKQGYQNSNFAYIRWTVQIFKIRKYEKKIKFNKIWGYHNGVSLSNEDDRF